jgi:hypothetical protein
MALILYLYQSRYPSNGRSEAWVIQGDEKLLGKYVQPKEYDDLFGGSILSSAETLSGEVKGVWGVKTIKRFRRVLRERGAIFQQLNESPPQARVKIIRRGGPRPKGLGKQLHQL